MSHLSGQDDGRGSVPAELRPDSGRGTADSERMLVNAAHTLCALKRTLRSDVGNFERELTYRAGLEMLHCYIDREQSMSTQSDARTLLDELVRLFARDGLGTFEITKFDGAKMIVEFSCPDSLEAFGYISHGETQDRPSCSFTCGLLAGAGRHAFGASDCEGPNEIVAAETSCASARGGVCKFIVGRRSRLEELGHAVHSVKESVSEHALRLNDEILTRNLDLQNVNLDLERQVRRKNEELKRAEERYASLVNLFPEPIIVCLTDGTIRSLNEAALALLGYGPEDMLESKNISTLLLDGTDAWEKCVWLVNKEGVMVNQEFGFVGKKGQKVVGEVSARISDMQPERSVQVVIRDVTERKMLSTGIEDAKADRDFFNDLIAVDIADYMSSAMRFLDRAGSPGKLPEDREKAIAIVTKDVKAAYELASVVRDLGKAEALSESECRTATEICSVVSEAVEEAKRMHSDRRVTVSVGKPSGSCYADGTPMLSRMFVNLLANAVKFDPSDEVVVEVRIEPVRHKSVEYWSVRISDHGKGIPDHEKEKVFERFFKGDKLAAGAGLGLVMARKVAWACGGLIWAEDRVQGDFTKGTTMVVHLRRTATADGANGRTR